MLPEAHSAPAPGQVQQAPQGQVQQIRILLQNIWGRNEGDCETRYRTLARKVLEASPRYDLVVFNEHWTAPAKVCDAQVLTDAMKVGGVYRGTSQHPRKEALWETSGGLTVFTPHPIKEYLGSRFIETRLMPLSGALFTRIELGPGREIDLWNTHLESTGADGCDAFCRLGQITDLAGWIDTYSSPERGDRRNPVLLAGDFNIPGPLSYMQRVAFDRTGYRKYAWADDNEYRDLVNELGGARDLWLEENIASPNKGYTYDCFENDLLRCTYQERIDYMFVLGDKFFGGAKAPPVKLKKMEVVKWKTPKGNPISDHYGLDATLEIDWSK